MKKFLALFVCTMVATRVFGAEPVAAPTALQLVKEGNKYIGEPSKNKVQEIASDKSVGALLPSVWTVAYHDPDTTFKRVEVKFGAGTKMGVSRPWSIGAEPPVLDLKKIKVDSSEAFRTATTQKLLEPFKLTNTQLWLKQGATAPEWKVRIWANRLGKTNSVVNIGDVFISAEDGKVLKADLHIERLN